MFQMRTSKPGSGNKFYITDESGGYSKCIKGNPTDKNCDVLSNCVGYACGRFNEIIGKMKYPYLNCNAERFIERAKEAGLEIGNTPKVGAIICWSVGSINTGNDGAGHVEVVEKVIDNNTIYTSASNYGGTAFYNATRRNTNGRWGIGSSYTFRGFIYNPAVQDEPEPTPAPTPSDKFNIGDKVYIEGNLYKSSNANEPSGYTAKKLTEITRKNPGSAHPYNTTGDLGWMNESSITKYEEPKPTPIVAGDTIIVNGRGTSASDGSGSTTRTYSNHKMKVIAIRNNAKYPYACNQYNEGKPGDYSKVTAWFRAEDVKKG